jgi:hypothetical protein
MDDGIRKDACIVSKNDAEKQKSRLAPAFSLYSQQAEPVRTYFLTGFLAFFLAAMVMLLKRLMNSFSDQLAKEVYAKHCQTWNEPFVRICKAHRSESNGERSLRRLAIHKKWGRSGFLQEETPARWNAHG